MVEQDTRQSLIQSALKLFAEQGFDGTSVKQICDKAKVNVSLVSYHFQGKDGLFRACLEPFAQAGLALAEKILATPETKEEFLLRLEMFTTELVSAHANNPELTRVLHRECMLDSSMARDFFDRTFHQVFIKFHDFVAISKKRGFVVKEIDPMIAASLYFGAISNFCNTDDLRKRFFKVSIQEPQLQKKVVEHLVRTFSRGVVV